MEISGYQEKLAGALAARTMRPEEVAVAQTLSVKYQDMLYTWSQHIRYTPGGGGVCFFLFLERFFRRGRRGGAPGFGSCEQGLGASAPELAEIEMVRSPGLQVKLADRGPAKVHHHPIFEKFQVHGFSNPRPAHEGGLALPMDATVFAHHPDTARARGFPRARIRKGAPATVRP